jgi:hypothetical protein
MAVFRADLFSVFGYFLVKGINGIVNNGTWWDLALLVIFAAIAVLSTIFISWIYKENVKKSFYISFMVIFGLASVFVTFYYQVKNDTNSF